MKVGDLVKDEFGTMGIVIETGQAHLPAVLVQFPPGFVYDDTGDSGWIVERLLEVINGSR